jgi:signal transduction histidine kinase
MPCIADQIGQVILNIVINAAHAVGDAIKSRKQGFGYIKIRTKHTFDAAMIEIEDSGGGIPAEVLPRIFEPFFTTKAVGKGTGQGLALVKTIIETNHQGTIQVETAVGVGTTFRIILPYKNEPTSPNPQHPVVAHAEATAPVA